eukprot:329677-Chlamydomonas_euryale.AAC.5
MKRQPCAGRSFCSRAQQTGVVRGSSSVDAIRVGRTLSLAVAAGTSAAAATSLPGFVRLGRGRLRRVRAT